VLFLLLIAGVYAAFVALIIASIEVGRPPPP
jgi:hypothetical protein